MMFSLAGTIAQAQAAQAAADAQAQAYEYEAKMQERNAKIAEQQARDASERGFVEEEALRRKAHILKGQQRAAFGASGLDTGTGTPLDVLADTAYLSESDAATIRYNAQQERYGFESQKGDQMGKAAMSKVSATNARIAGSNAATATILGGIGSVANQWYRFKAGI